MHTTWMKNLAAAGVATLGLALLVGSGGGGDGGGGGGTANYNLSGSISIAESAAVDSDLNDINQADYRINDDTARAQALTAPFFLVGTVNEANTGPRGNNNDGTANINDVSDIFRVDLVAGQVVELEFASDPAASDVDLYVQSTDGAQGGASNGVDSRFECVRITQAGSYYVQVFAFRSASIYSLRIGAPGTSASCAQATGPLNFIANQLVAEPKRGSSAAAEKAGSLMRAAGMRLGKEGEVVSGALQADAGPQLLMLPADPVLRDTGLKALAAKAGPASAQAAPALSAAAVARRARSAAAPWPEAWATLQYAKQLRASGAFEYVEPNRLMQTMAITGAFPPNDRAYSYQRWHYELISLPSAMQRITDLNLPGTQARPVVAVIDDGVVLDHPDLQPQLFSVGRSFVSINSAGDADVANGDNNSTAADQPVFHGTHVAGTVGASTYDGIGGAGTAPMALILPLRVFPPNRGAATIDILQAIRYAARLSNRSGQLPTRRADVINLSLGSDSACDSAYQTAMNDARAAGVIIVAAAGNSGNNPTQRAAVGSPASCTGVIAVSAVDARRSLTRYSNSGSELRVAAPGGDTSVSTTGNGAPDGVYSDVATFDAAGRRQPGFGAMQGTSMASPHVAGVMALMRFVNPGLTVAQVDSLFAAGSLTDDIGTAGRDIDYGFGLINARKAVEAALGALTSPPPQAPAQVVALPSELNFGAAATTAVIDVNAPGTTNESVTSVQVVNAPANGVTVTPTSVNASNLGRYTVGVNRNAFGNGTFYPVINFNLSSARVVSVQLTVQKTAGGGAANAANFGPIYVLLIDPDSGNVEHTVLATHTGSGYTWSRAGYAKSRVAIVAGADLDNDDFICARGEPCGAFPVLGAGLKYEAINLNGNRSDLNFQVSPLSGISPSAAGAAAPSGWRRQPAAPLPEVLRGTATPGGVQP